MILHKKTFIKFGYHPKELPKRSHKPILYKCSSCSKIRPVEFQAYHRKRSTNCSSCSARAASKQRAQRVRLTKRENFKKLKSVKLSSLEMLELWENYTLSRRNRNGALPYLAKSFMGANDKMALHYIKTSRVLGILKFLGLQYANIDNKKFKAALVSKISKLPPLERFRLVNHMMVNSTMEIRANTIRLGRVYKRWNWLFRLVSFEVKSTGNATLITKGSIFKDHKWIHVG